MQQQPLLTPCEVLNLVIGKGKVPMDCEEYLAVNYIVGRDYSPTPEEESGLISPDIDFILSKHYGEEYGCFFISPKYIPVLQDCANYLRSQGYHVFFRLEFDDHVRFYRCDFVVGECARLLDRIYSLANYLNDLKGFVDKQKHELPPNLVSEQAKIEDYLDSLWGEYEEVLQLYTESWKESLKGECKKAWKLVEEVETYLDSIIDLRRLHALSLIL
jgi:hypothetical protein